MLTKSPCQKLSPKKSTKISISVFLSIFWVLNRFMAFSGVSQRWEFKNTTKRFTKKSCRKVFTKKSTKTQNRLFLDFFNHVYGRFLVRGGQKHAKKSGENFDQP
jgi:hypothetical protein